MDRVGTSDGSERRRYRWCPACQELWVVGRFGGSCPLCGGRTFAYVGRSPYEVAPTERRQPSLERGVDLVDAAVIWAASQGLHDWS